MSNLSHAQRDVVRAPIGRPIQVLASAGSGKTRVLVERVRHILESTIRDGIIALTFTNRAAEEMRTRLADLDAIDNRCWITTIHGVAQRILDQYGHTIGLPSELHIYEREQDRKMVFLQSLREQGVDIDTFLDVVDTKIKRKREKTLQDYLEDFSLVKRELLTESEVKMRYAKKKNFWMIYQSYQQALLQSGGMDFDDILVYAHRILLEQPWCGKIYRAKYKHICVDEAQDLNRAQYEFVKALCADELTSLMMVGDPDQMIFGFNGSSSEFLCRQFLLDFAPIQFVLNENFRSSQAVIQIANKLKPGSQVESSPALLGRSQIKAFHDEEAEARWICDTVGLLLKTKIHHEIEGEISLHSIVIIARNRFVFHTLEQELNNRKVPYLIKRHERHAELTSVFGKMLDLAIRVRLNPKDWVGGKELCEVLKIASPQTWGERDMLAILASSVKNADIPFAGVLARSMLSIQDLDTNHPNIPKLCLEFSKSIYSLGVSAEDTDSLEIERSLQELEVFQKSWTIFRQKGLGESLQAFRNAMALGQLEVEYNKMGLTLSTVHTMKGLEKDIVFLMGMCEGVFPDYRAVSTQELIEERNNAFVAVTRARRWIYISYPQQRQMPWGEKKVQQPSRFVTEMRA